MSFFKKKVGGLGGLLQRKDSQNDEVDANSDVVREIKKFCQSADRTDDLAALVIIPDYVFSSPQQAQEAAKMLRKELSDRSKPGNLYNAAMLISILVRHRDSAGFTPYVDDRLVGTIKLVLRDTTDLTASVRQFIQEFIREIELTISGQQPWRSLQEKEELEHRQARWTTDAGIKRLLDLRHDPKNWQWAQRQQTALMQPQLQQRPVMSSPPSHRQISTLPGPQELAERLTEAENTSQMLSQMILANPSAIMTDPMIREFHARSVEARNSLETYLRLTSDRATFQNIDSAKVKVDSALGKYDDAVRRHMSRPEPQQTTRAFAAQPTQFAAPVPVRAQPRAQVPVANGDVSPIDATAWSDDPFDDSHEAGRANHNGAAYAQNGGIQKPVLAVSTGTAQTSTPPAVSSDLATEPERPTRYRF